ncbi:MAG: hypothetical protein JWL69_983 [Phycisphaerales bacterium]|nr:hypothetical protein [Phycisphaerales bacterium]
MVLFRVESCGDYTLGTNVILNGNSPALFQAVNVHDYGSGSRGQRDRCVENHSAPAHLGYGIDLVVQVQIDSHQCRIPDGGLLESHGGNP